MIRSVAIIVNNTELAAMPSGDLFPPPSFRTATSFRFTRSTALLSEAIPSRYGSPYDSLEGGAGVWSGVKGQLDYVSAGRADRRYAHHLGYRRCYKLYGHHYARDLMEKSLILVLASSGMRAGALTELTWGDLMPVYVADGK